MFEISLALIGIIVPKTSRSFSLRVAPVSTITTITSVSASIGASSTEPFSLIMSISLQIDEDYLVAIFTNFVATLRVFW